MKPLRSSIVFSIFVSLSLPVMAQSTWNGTTNVNWSTSTNWAPGIPASGANITIADTTPNGLTLDDASHTVGNISTGNRTSVFTLQTNTANTLTISGGITANGNFTVIGPRLRGNYLISDAQTWQVGGALGTHAVDSGLAVNEVATGSLGTVTLNANLNKSGTGQLTFGATTISGAGDLNVNEGSLKLNAGGSLLLTVGGTGKITANNSSTVILSKNSGTFSVTRPFQFNNTSSVVTGSGSNNLTGTFDIPSNMEWNGIHTITNNSNANNSGNVNYQFSGVMSGTGSVTKTGVSQLVLSGTAANTLSGQVTVAGGELFLDKTDVIAIPGNILVTGGTLRINKPNQIADSSGITVTGGGIAYTAERAETIASLSINSGTVSSVSGFTVTGATTLTSGLHQLNSAQTFTTNSLAISNNATLQFVGEHATGASTVNVGVGGLSLDSGTVAYGNPGKAGTMQLNLSGNVVSTGTSLFSAASYDGPRLLDLQGASRTFAVNSGTLDIRTNVGNGTLVKSGAGTLLLSRAGSTADFSFTEGPVRIVSQNNAGNVTLSGGSLLMDIGGDAPAGINVTGNFTVTDGTIEISATNATVTAGTKELVRYGTLTGSPVINIPPQLVASRMNPVVNLGSGTNSAITITSDAAPLNLTWSGAAAGGLWDNNTTSNFSGGQKFFALDSAIFDDTASNSSVLLNSIVIPTDVVFDHGVTRPTYTVSGTGAISGATKLTKKGEGTTILATDNTYTGLTDILAGKLQIGNGGIVGSLGTGGVNIASGSTLAFSRGGTAVVGNVITGGGVILNNGPGITAFTANSKAFLGTLQIAGGTLQFGNGEADGFISGNVEISAGATFAVKRTGTPTITNMLSGDGAFTISGGGPIISTYNYHRGGTTIKDDGVLRATFDGAFGELPNYSAPTPDAIRLNHGGIKNQDSFTQTDSYRGITITDEAYFTAGWAKGLIIDGPITGTGNVFINYDSGYVTLSNEESNWTGILTLGGNKPGFTGTTGGILQIATINNAGVAGPLGKASADPANLVFDGGTLRYGGGEDASTTRGATLQTTGTIDLPGSALTLSGRITGPGALTKSGVGTLVLSGNSDFLGIKTISGGSVVLKSTTGLGDTAGFVKFTTGPSAPAVLELATNTSAAAYGLDMAAGTVGTIQSGVATAGPGINHTLGNFTLSSATLNVVASTSVTGGDPRVTIGSMSLTAGATGNTTLNPTTANITLGATTIGIGNFAKNLNLSGTSLNNVASGVISDGLNVLGLNKYGDSTWTLSGDNTFTGNVLADDGILVLAHTNALGGAGKTLNVYGDSAVTVNKLPEVRLTGGISPTVAIATVSGTGAAGTTGVLNNLSGDNTLNITTALRLNVGNGGTTLFSTAGTFTINTPLVTTIATGRVLTLSGAGNGVINGAIVNGTTGALPVIKTGAGKWTLNGAHTYTGATTVSQGVLSLGQAALADAAAVTVAAGATLDLNFAGIDRVGSLTINGVVKANGVYSAATDPGFITGTGSIRVGAPAGEGYTSWAANYPFTAGANDGPSNDPDGDGISNLLEYVLGGVPVGAGAGNTSILPTQSLTANSLILTFKRSDLSEADVTLKVQWSDNLATWNDFATIGAVDALPAVDITEDSPSAAIDTVVVTIPRSLAPGGRIFTRLKASK